MIHEPGRKEIGNVCVVRLEFARWRIRAMQHALQVAEVESYVTTCV